jgi:hypothetical protein
MAERATQIARYVAEHPAFAPYAPRYGYPAGSWLRGSRPAQSAAELAEAMVEDVGFQALQLGGFLMTPDGELIAEGVRMALPSTDRVVFDLAVESLTLAAQKQATISRRQVGAALLVGLLLLRLLSSGESSG